MQASTVARTGVQFFQYGLVGFVGWLIGLGVLAGLTELANLPYALSYVGSGVTTLLTNFALNKAWTFRGH